MTDVERLHDIEQKLRCWGYLSHYPDAEHDVAWLLDQLAEREVRIAGLEGRLRRNEWAFPAAARPGLPLDLPAAANDCMVPEGIATLVGKWAKCWNPKQ